MTAQIGWWRRVELGESLERARRIWEASMKRVLMGGAAAMFAVLVFGAGWAARSAERAAQNAAQTPAQSAAQSAAQTQRVPQFENEDVKVWKSLVLPNQPLTMHRHDHPRVIIALKGGTMKIVEQDGASETHVWETGKAYWLAANAPNTSHADVNAGAEPIEVMVVELEKEK
jgi:beta-alanine degradation protein BauB